jgi:hypothetical protein
MRVTKIYWGRDSAFGIATCLGWTVLGSNPGGGEVFRTRPHGFWGPTQPPIQWVLGLFPGGKTSGAWH